MANGVKFMKHYVEGNGVKARVFYSPGALIDGRSCVTLYARDYDRKLGKVFEGVESAKYENDTDVMTDYFDEGRVRIFPDSPLYAAVMARVEANKAAAEAKAAPSKAKPERWYCCACGALSSIGDKPVKKSCSCVDRGV